MKSNRWQAISPSAYPWEQAALDFLSAGLPDHEPFRGWSNFEFIADDGTINEVDALILGPNGLYLVEIKSRPGEITGDTHSWTWRHDGRAFTDDNPLFLANRKARKLASLLKRQKEFSRQRLPFIEAIVFCSDASNRLKLPDSLAQRVFIRDQGNPLKGGVIDAVTQRRPSDSRDLVDAALARNVGRAINQSGIRSANQARRVSDYTLQKVIYEHPQGTYQDWSAKHASIKDDHAMVRIYPRAHGQSADQQALAARSAEREYALLQTLEHVGILQVRTHTAHESGPALVFRFAEKAQRLDHFMREHGGGLSFDLRLTFVRQLAESLRFAHGHKVAHRQLCPQSIFVFEPKPGDYQLKIYNWQLGQRLQSTTGTSVFSPTLHADQLSDQTGSAFLAPEGLRDADADGEAQDVFALGALAYFIFSGQPPSESSLETAERVRAQRGLQLSGVLDGAPKVLCDLVQQSTAPAILDRTENVRAFLKQVDEVDAHYKQPESDKTVPPLVAKTDDRIALDLIVKHRLGSGSTAVAHHVEWTREDGPRDVVLKIASRPDHTERIRSEFEVLKKLRHPRIVEAFELRDFDGGLSGILVSSAGPKTLAQHLRDEGPLTLDFLERFGTDLLEAIGHLEQEGFPHRDLKPENIGIRRAKDGTEHLALFDFSLSTVPSENIRCGTTAYLDPFLTDRKPPRWDSSAERYSAALTLYEMATGDLPKWSQDDSHPAALKNEILLEAERFDAGIRDELQRFFAKALRRDFRQRFDNAVDMLTAWRGVFRLTESVHPTTPHPEGQDHVTLIEAATLETNLVFLGITNRAANALERAGFINVGEFLLFPRYQLKLLKGIGRKTTHELTELYDALRLRFPHHKQTKRTTSATEVSGSALGAVPDVHTLDLVAEQLLAGGGKGEGSSGREALHTLLGVGGARTPASTFWPSQTESAKLLGVTRQRVGQILDAARERWKRNPALTSIRNSIVEFIQTQGGSTTPRELAQALLSARGSTLEEPQRTRTALAVARAAVETEQAAKESRFSESRNHGRLVLSVSPELADLAFELGDEADQLAALDPLATPQRTLERLRAVTLPDGYVIPPGVAPLSDNRLLQLAVANSHNAALSARGEIYPKGMEAKRVLQLAQGALFVSTDISTDDIQRRVLARYPDAAPLPPRPELDRLLADLGSRLTWVDQAANGQGAFRPASASEALSHTSATHVARTADRRTTNSPASPGQQAALDFETRLRHAHEQGAFLVLMVPSKSTRDAEARLRQRFDLLQRDFDGLLISALKQTASDIGAGWETVLRADGADPASRDWTRLQQLVTKGLPTALTALEAPEHTVLLTHPGLLARYDRMASLASLAAEIGRSGSRLHGLWILLPCDDQNALPTLLHKPVPVTSSAQWARVPTEWITGSQT